MERDRLKAMEVNHVTSNNDYSRSDRMLSVDSLVHTGNNSSVVDSPLSEMALNTEFNFSVSDANLLYNDLNEIVNSRLEEALTPTLKTYIEETANPFNTDLMNEDDNDEFANKGIIFNVPLDYFSLGDPHNHYLSLYFENFSTLSSPLMPNIGLNPIRDVLLNYAKRETYLLYAILACGAKTAFRQSEKIEDDQAYCSYLSSCLNILSEHFADENLIIDNVEPMLLTILLLTSDCASSKNVRWRAHLKGAKELFKKFSIDQSDILNFCRNWLITYEVLAGVTNTYGGIFQSDTDELDKFITNDARYLKSLKKLNMIDIHGFNYISGHIIDLDLVFKEIIKMLNKMRKLKLNPETKTTSHLSSNIPPIVSYDKIETLMVQLHSLQQKEIIDKSGIIPSTNPNHPSQTNFFQQNNFDSIETIKLPIQNKTQTLSWYDISHQAHIIAAKLIIMTKILEFHKSTSIIQDLVRKALNFIRFLNEIDHYNNKCITHLHFVMVIVGPNCITIQDQSLVRKFLELCRSMGLESAAHNLKKFEKIWLNGDEHNDDDDGEEEDILTW